MTLYAFKFDNLIIPINSVFSIYTYVDCILIKSGGGVEEKIYMKADDVRAFEKNPKQFIVKLEL